MMELLVLGPNPLGEMGPNPSGVAATARLTGTGPSIEYVEIGEYCYGDAFETTPPEAYETLLLDVILGDATLFLRADQVEEAWSVVTPILEGWESAAPVDFPNYQAGTWGPEAAEALIAQDGRSWLMPDVVEEPGA